MSDLSGSSELMLTIVTIGIAMTAWGLVVAKADMLQRGKRDKRIVSLWTFFLLFALSTTLHIEPLREVVDHLLGIDGLTWFMSSLLLVLAFYAAGQSVCMAMELKTPSWMSLGLTAVMGLLVAFFPFAANRAVAALSNTVKNVFVVVMLAKIAMTFRPSRRSERGGTVRTRILIVQLGSLSVAAAVAMRISTDWLDIMVSGNLVAALKTGTVALLGLGSLIWPWFYVPNKWLWRLVQPWLFYQKWLALRDLRRLQCRLNLLCPTVRPPDNRWPFQGIDLHLYRSLIAILDCRKALADRLEHNASGWDTRGREEATRLYNAIRRIPDLEFDDLVGEVGKVARSA